MGMGTRATAATLAALALVGCEDGTEPFGGGSTAMLSIAVPAQSTAATPGLSAAMAVEITDDAGRTLDVQRIQVVLEELELKRALHDLCEEEDDACEEFEAGPVLIDLPVEGGVITPFSMPVPPDTYVELELEIDEPDDDSTAAEFFAQNPGWVPGASIRVVGTFDANDGAGPQAFDVFLEVDGEIERELVPPLVIDESSPPVNVTVEIDVATWFRRFDGSLIDPRGLTADDDLLDQVEENIEASFDAFGDDDRDGSDDDSEDDSDSDGSDDD